MSTEDPGIPLTHAPDARGYKLMELPPDLEALLTAEDAPKNTSNSLILLAPHSTAPSPDSSDDSIPVTGLAAIATIHETIELVAQTEPQTISNLKNTGSKGKWHEKFGRGR
ncbi:hypothetical protein CCUS01_02419 [Colletotrichum cuscutae]|uniref:Sister chromatid cohesion protein DCC1 n=1 Tax=Colletotrichum cuscutae TaxID=1209917 RepID=A0AAI9XFX1_9PEZI|nr:hypothetical protein CCUS01_02419 [Colletotrichum cuscutae]